MEKIQIIAAIVLFVAFLMIINMVRRKTLEIKYAMLWLVVLFLAMILDAFPVLLRRISFLLGIKTPVNTLFVLAFCFAIVLIFALTVAASRQAAKIRHLAQAMAILEEKIKKQEENNDTSC